MSIRGIWPAAGLLWLAVIACGVGALHAEDVRRRSVELEPSVLQGYVGQYELAPKVLLTLRRDGAYLTAQITGQPEIVVYAENETTFFWKVVDAHFTIEKGEDGKVDGLRFEQGAAKIKAKKVSSELPKAGELAEIEETMDSPRLGALAKELKKGNREALKTFWNDAQNKAPIIEPVAGDKHSSWVSFVWHGDANTHTVSMTGGLPTPDDTKWLTRLGDTDLWYRTERIPNDARFAYWFQINRPLKMPRADNPQGLARVMELCPSRPDPLNPREVSLQGMILASVLELPAAPPHPWLKRRPDVPQGVLKDRKTTSESLKKEERAVTIYTPANYDPKGEAYGLLVLFDGDWYQDSESIPGPVILDNLIAAKKVKPLVAVFVKQPLQTRNRDLCCSEPFAAFVARELVPWVEKEYHVSADPKHRIIGGLSLGGLMASYCGLHHPDVFGNVLSQSGAYQWYPGSLERGDSVLPDAEPGSLTREFVASSRRALRFYLEAGRFEGGFASLLAENQRFRDVLLAKGYPVTWSPFTGGHDFVSWRGSFADALITLAGADNQSK